MNECWLKCQIKNKRSKLGGRELGKMIEIIINDNVTSIKTNDIEFCIEGSFEIKKEGAEAPIVSVIANKQK